jgi:ppGpp synthetase/RelA/SpoT-type nucleotidyltranferase
MTKPRGIDEYIEWAKNNIGTPFDDQKIKSVYETNMNNIFNSVSEHQFFVGFSNISKSWQKEYEGNTKTELFMDNEEPALLIKPFESTVEKTYRVNVLWNRGFPEPPRKGWIDQKSIYAELNDLVRGSLVCRFIDGPAFVADSIENYAKSLGLNSRQYTQERDDGYYAYHVYVKFPVSIFNLDWEKSDILIEIEIQITTQLQEVLRSLTHKFYETQRLSETNDKGKWKWDFSSTKFKVGYLSHTLHLLESVILESRDSVMNDEASEESK